jgi:CheY-like chemotaxis protein
MADESSPPLRRLGSGVRSVRSMNHLVLYVEDAPDIRGLYATYLRKAGLRVAEASNGVEGVERAIELQPALVLMDLQLPMVDGYEATRRLKKHPRTKHIPVVVLSALDCRDREASIGREGGESVAAFVCDAFLTKPIHGNDLVKVVVDLLEKNASELRSTGTR